MTTEKEIRCEYGILLAWEITDADGVYHSERTGAELSSEYQDLIEQLGPSHPDHADLTRVLKHYRGVVWEQSPNGDHSSETADGRRGIAMISPMSCSAYHEAGHAVAGILAWRFARQPVLQPRLLIKYVEISEPKPGWWGGICGGPQIYTTKWPESTRIAHQWREAMEWQIVADLAGGIAEAIYRGERAKRHVLMFALLNCGTCDGPIDGPVSDLTKAEATLSDLRKLTRRHHGLQRFAEKTFKLMLMHWHAVEALAQEPMENKRVEGERVEKIFDENVSEDVWWQMTEFRPAASSLVALTEEGKR